MSALLIFILLWLIGLTFLKPIAIMGMYKCDAIRTHIRSTSFSWVAGRRPIYRNVMNNLN